MKSFKVKIKNDFLDVDILIKPQTIIFGPSGSGKSTLLKYINNSISILSPDQVCTLMLQHTHLFDFWTILENLVYPQIISLNRSFFIAEEKAKDLLLKFNLNHKAKLFPVGNNLSGGEQQRIGLIRTVLFDYDFILLDEPTSALDIQNTKFIVEILEKYHFVMATHDLKFAKKIGKNFIFMINGKVIESGPNILENPQSLLLQEFLLH